MKKILFTLPIATLFIIALSMSENTAHGSSNNAPPGYTGSPGDGKTCGTNGGCHNTGSAPFLAGILSSNIPSSGYIPGQTYIFTINYSVAGAPVSSKVGCSISPQDALGNLVGTLVVGTGTKLNGSSVYISHTGTLMNSTVRTFSWVAPPTALDSVVFYGAINYTNSQGNSSGDAVRTTTYTVKRDLINSLNIVKNIFNYINVSSQNNNILLHLETENISKVAVQVLDINGKNVVETKSFDLINGKNDLQIHLGNAPKGLYAVNIITNKQLPITKKVITN
jgi:hypothetical protein